MLSSPAAAEESFFATAFHSSSVSETPSVIMKSIFSPKRQGRRERSGSAIVEVAVCFPVFLMILLGIIEFGRAMSVNQLLNTASRIGCRAAILDGSTNTSVSNTVKSSVASMVGCNQNSVTVSIAITRGTATVANLSSATTGDTISINTTVPFSTISWAVGSYLTNSSLRGQCSMIHE
jgi:Flp pilus assembly protein TadG